MRTGATQSGIGRVAGVVQDLVMSAGCELTHDRSCQRLFDPIGLRLVDEGGDGDRLHVLGQRDVMAGGVVSAACGSEQKER